VTKLPALLSRCDDVFDLSVDKLENSCGRDDNLIIKLLVGSLFHGAPFGFGNKLKQGYGFHPPFKKKLEEKNGLNIE